VFDVHHKPHGLTSLPSCHLSQAYKVQHKPRKKSPDMFGLPPECPV
jgi:hypothetical protein